MKKNHIEDKNETTYITDDDGLTQITDIINSHSKLYIEYPDTEIPVKTSSMLRVCKLADIVPEESTCEIYARSEKKAVKYLTDFSVSEADRLFEKWKDLDEYLLVKYIDGNTKKQEADGSFTTNGHTDYVPVTPNFPGYTEEFKRVIAESQSAK